MRSVLLKTCRKPDVENHNIYKYSRLVWNLLETCRRPAQNLTQAFESRASTWPVLNLKLLISYGKTWRCVTYQYSKTEGVGCTPPNQLFVQLAPPTCSSSGPTKFVHYELNLLYVRSWIPVYFTPFLPRGAMQERPMPSCGVRPSVRLSVRLSR